MFLIASLVWVVERRNYTPLGIKKAPDQTTRASYVWVSVLEYEFSVSRRELWSLQICYAKTRNESLGFYVCLCRGFDVRTSILRVGCAKPMASSKSLSAFLAPHCTLWLTLERRTEIRVPRLPFDAAWRKTNRVTVRGSIFHSTWDTRPANPRNTTRHASQATV